MLFLSLLLPPLCAAQAKITATSTVADKVGPPKPLSATVAAIRAAKVLRCGVVKEEEDYSRVEDHGNRAAMDLDVCKAVAVAVLGPGARFVVQAYPDEPAATLALRKGEVELLASASPTVPNTAAGIGFARPTFYDGEGLMFANNPAITKPADLAEKKICFLIDSQTEIGLRSYAAREHIQYIWYPFSEAGEMEAAFFTGNCGAMASDVSQLANTRAIDPARSHEFTILPQLLRQDPLAPAFRANDALFGAIVDWTVETLIEGEELGITRENVAAIAASATANSGAEARPEVVQLLGQRYGTGALLGLDDHWGTNVITAVGNYGQMFSRDLGEESPLRLNRGENRLWTQGGLMYALPVANQ